MDELKEIKEKLAAIESILQQLPEIQAAVFFKMQEEYRTAKMQGLDISDIWDITLPQSGRKDNQNKEVTP